MSILKSVTPFEIEQINWIFIIVVWCIIFIFLVGLVIKKRNYEAFYLLKSKVFHSQDFQYFDNILLSLFPYYKTLSIGLRKKFINRLAIFLKVKQFVPRQMEANQNLNILIAATATQLTFGFKNFSLLGFQKILIYPDAYFSEIRKQYHKGEINVQAKLIVLSARHFLDGIVDYNDGINLGLHEMAHALNINEFENKNIDFIKRFKAWEKVAKLELEEIKVNEKHFMRKYAATNMQEMFAVSTEYFFEKPLDFNAEIPILYQQMCLIYQQNPLNKSKPTE